MGIIDIEGVSKRFKLRRSRLFPPSGAGADPDEEIGTDEAEDQEQEHAAADGPGVKWALKDVTASIAPGERVAILGGNGAGKSILLKIIAGLSLPTEGIVRGRGRVVAVNAMLSPFDPSKSGVDNVRIMARLMRVERSDLESRLAAIVDFSGLRDQAEQPVRTYSSGMYPRLGLAAVLHLDPDVLLVDGGVKAGDEAFQQSVAEKFEAIIGHGATLLDAGQKLRAVACERALWLEDGRLREDGPNPLVRQSYQDAMVARVKNAPAHQQGNGAISNGLAAAGTEQQSQELAVVDDAAAEIPKWLTHRVLLEVTLDEPGTARDAERRVRGMLGDIDVDCLSRHQISKMAAPKLFADPLPKKRERDSTLAPDMDVEESLSVIRRMAKAKP